MNNKWTTEPSILNEVIEETVTRMDSNVVYPRFGIPKKKFDKGTSAKFPFKRPLTFKEEKVMREYFGNDYTWSSIDDNNHILLFRKGEPQTLAWQYIQLDDLQREVNKSK